MNVIKERLKAETPEFWVKIGNWSLMIGLGISAVGGTLMTAGILPGVASVVVTVGACLAAIGKLYASMTTK